jgi:hypothetical protein
MTAHLHAIIKGCICGVPGMLGRAVRSPLVATKLIALPVLYIRVVLLVVDEIRSIAPSN